MASIDQVRASDGSGNAQIATVQSTRSGGSSTIDVDTVTGIPDFFMGSMGTPHTFTDPITSEEITVISEATAVDFSGHVDGANLEIDDIAPGYVDAGSEIGDIVIIRPTTQYADNLADILDVSHDDDGDLKDDIVTNAKVAAGNLVQGANTVSTAVATGTTVIPLDDTIPQITEGTEFMTVSITPKSTTNILVIEALAHCATSTARNIVIALFQGATANALAASAVNMQIANNPIQVALRHAMVAGTTSAITFRIRIGPDAAGTITFNGGSAARLFGAITKSSIVVYEYKA